MNPLFAEDAALAAPLRSLVARLRDTGVPHLVLAIADNDAVRQEATAEMGERLSGSYRLAEFDWEGYRQTYGDIQRLDRILEAEGDTPNRYKLSKQADVLMLFYLFSADELGALFERLGYAFPDDTITLPRAFNPYNHRTILGGGMPGPPRRGP